MKWKHLTNACLDLTIYEFKLNCLLHIPSCPAQLALSILLITSLLLLLHLLAMFFVAHYVILFYHHLLHSLFCFDLFPSSFLDVQTTPVSYVCCGFHIVSLVFHSMFRMRILVESLFSPFLPKQEISLFSPFLPKQENFNIIKSSSSYSYPISKFFIHPFMFCHYLPQKSRRFYLEKHSSIQFNSVYTS